MKKAVCLLVFVAVAVVSAAAYAFAVRCYNKDSKRYTATFVCKGNVRRTVEVRKGTTTLSTNASGPCKFKLGGHSITIRKGDKIEIKNGVPKKV